MKSHKFIAKFMIAAFVACIVGACTDLAKIEDRLDDLDSKVTALQAQISALNNNVETFKYLKDGAVITEIQEVAGGYELTLSDGRTLTVNHGENGTNGNTPTISINENGFWVINGNDQTVPAAGVDGVTPKFAVDADGYWVVSYNNGTSYERVNDADGNPVKAKVEITNGTPVEADSFFSSVEVKDNLLVLTLRADGTEVEVPIVKGFKFVISKNGNLVEGVQKIQYGTTVTFDVEQAGVASAAIVACPAGFEVELTETSLSVKAPAKDSEDNDNENIFIDFSENNDNYYITKASASLSKDLAILVVSNKGLSILSKIQLEATEPQPEASLSNSTHECYSFNSVKLNATVVNGDRVHRVIKAASKPAATAEELLNTIGFFALDGTVTLSETNLAPSTEYVAYYLASDGTKHGDVQRFEFSTRAVDENNLYEKYATGETITVAGLEISKTNYPTALYICRGTTTRGVDKTGLCFIESNDDITANFNSGIYNLITVGTNPSKRANVTRSNGKALLDATNADNDYMILANLNYTVGTADHIFQLNKADNFENIYLENTYFNIPAEKALLAYVNNDRKINNFTMVGCDTKVTTKGFLIQSRNTPIQSMDFQNNVIFSDNSSLLYVLDYSGSNLTDVTNVNIDNNTFYNVSAPGGSQGYVRAKSIANITVTDNLFYDCLGASYNTFIYYNTVPVASANASSNVSSIPKDSAYKVYIVNGTSPAGVTNPTSTDYDFPITEWDPSKGIFKIDGTYKNVLYGATR